MNHVLKPENAGREILTGWSLSILFHGVLLVAVITLMPKMMVAVEKETFRWDVALVDKPQEQVSAPPTVQQSKTVPPPPAKPQRQVARPVEPVPQTVTQEVQTREVPQPVQREVQTVMETIQPIERPVPAPEVVNLPSPEVKQTETVTREVASADVIRDDTPE